MPLVSAFNHLFNIDDHNPSGIKRTHPFLDTHAQSLELLNMRKKLTAYVVLRIFVQLCRLRESFFKRLSHTDELYHIAWYICRDGLVVKG